MQRWRRTVAHGFMLAPLLCTVGAAAAPTRIPLQCTKGPSGQHSELSATVPATVEPGATFKVRIQGANSGKISHAGLRYIHHMSLEVLVPLGTELVAGSARVVPGTGSESVRAGATVTKQGGSIRLLMPGQVDDGSSYTPPAFEFQLKVTAAAGSKIVQRFSRYEVDAKAIIIGDVHTTCDPTPRPFPIATTSVVAAAKE